MMKTILCLLLLCTLASAQIRKFKANFAADEINISNGDTVRSYGGVFYYEDTWTGSSGRQSMRLDINLNDGTTTRTLTQLYVFQDQFFKYTICNGRCAWQDVFAEEPLPRLYVISGDRPTGQNTQLFGVDVTPYTFSQTNAINTVYNNFVNLWVRASGTAFPVQAELRYAGIGILQRLTFTSQEQNFDSNIFNVPTGCPKIQPGCFRVDISVVIDTSGSVTNAGVIAGVQFIIGLVNSFLIGPKNVKVGLVSFSHCYSPYTKYQFPMDDNKNRIINFLNNLISPQSLFSDGWTCIVGGISAGFNNYNSTNGGRPATRKAVIVITDGNGNRPCSTRTVDVSPGEVCSQWDTGVTGTLSGCRNVGASPCNGDYCCQAVHDWQLKYFYQRYYALTSPTIYAVGVGGSEAISDATLRLIVNDPTAIARGDPRIFRVDSWFSLGSILTALAKALLCDVPGAETCPNDCRPGGFCCAGACLCSIDCSLQSTECQAGTCRADANGASCVLGAPDNSSCQDPRIQCQDRYCVLGEGCEGFPNDNKPCTDNNACTDDRCQGGVCVSTRNDTVANCDDRNGCTLNDRCLPDGSCQGTKDDSANCTDGNACTADSCFNATCVSVPNVPCEDTNNQDCLRYQCDPATGECVPVPIEPGFYCRDPSTVVDRDNCTVYICDRFDPDAWATCIANGNGDKCNTGQCKKATRDLDRCKDSSINTAGIIGGVIAGVAFLAIIALAIIILILFLLRKKVIDVLGSLNPFGKDVFVHENPTHVNPVTSHTVPDLT